MIRNYFEPEFYVKNGYMHFVSGVTEDEKDQLKDVYFNIDLLHVENIGITREEILFFDFIWVDLSGISALDFG